jgi:hypothetical protein
MLTTLKSPIVAYVAIALGVAYIWIFAPPFIITAIFACLCIMWSAWTFISVFRGTDELNSAGTRYALALASGVGVPLSIVFVMLTVAVPSVQDIVSNIATFGQSGLSPAAIGFSLGVVFTTIIQCAVCAIGYAMWWRSKR